MKPLHILLIFFLFNYFNNIYADDPYCDRYFDGKIIITNKTGGAVYQSPTLKSELLLTLEYAQVVEGCNWDTYPDTINHIPGHWRKVKTQDTIGFVFSTDGYYFDPITYSEEKIIMIKGYQSINYCLTNNFYGIFKTPNGDSLLKCNIEFKRYSREEINDYNQRGPYNEMCSGWHTIVTDKPYECKLLFATKQTFMPQRINIVTYKTSLEERVNNFEIGNTNCLTSRFNAIRQDSKTENGYEMIDFYHLLIQAGENRNIDTVYTCQNCDNLTSFTFDFFGDINGDKIGDFLLIRIGSNSVYKYLFLSQKSNSSYRIIDE